MSSSSVPPQAPSSDPPHPSTGSPGAGSPASSVLSADSDTSTPLPPRSVFPRSAVLSARPSSLPAGGTTLRDLGLFYRGARAAFSPMETSRPPRFLGDPCRHAPLSDPGGPLMPGHCHMRDAAFRSEYDVGSAIYSCRGSITRPAYTLCTLRSRGRPRSTQHSVPAGGQPLPGQDSHLLGHTRRFPSINIPLHDFLLLQASPGANSAEFLSRVSRPRSPAKPSHRRCSPEERDVLGRLLLEQRRVRFHDLGLSSLPANTGRAQWRPELRQRERKPSAPA